MSKITVVDSIMGSGKTSWSIQYINENEMENVLYISHSARILKLMLIVSVTTWI